MSRQDYPAYEANQEALNWGACAEAFHDAYPSRHPDAFEDCDDGKHSCPACPWKKVAQKHAYYRQMHGD